MADDATANAGAAAPSPADAVVNGSAIVAVSADPDGPEFAKVPKSAATGAEHTDMAQKPLAIWFSKHYHYVPASAVRSHCKESNVITLSPTELGKLLPCKSPKAWLPYLNYKNIVLLVGGESGNGCVYTTFAVAGTPEQRILRVVHAGVAEKVFPRLSCEFEDTVAVTGEAPSRQRIAKRFAALEWRKTNAHDFKVPIVVRGGKAFLRDWQYKPVDKNGADTDFNDAESFEKKDRNYEWQEGDELFEIHVPGCKRPQIMPEIEHWPYLEKTRDNLTTMSVASKPSPRTKKGAGGAAADDDDDAPGDAAGGTILARVNGSGSAAAAAGKKRARADGADAPQPVSAPHLGGGGVGLLGKRMRGAFLAFEESITLAHSGPYHVLRAGPNTVHILQYHHEDPADPDDEDEEGGEGGE